MVVNFTGGARNNHRRVQRRQQADITGTPAYTSALTRALGVRIASLRNKASAGSKAEGGRGGKVEKPTFEFAFARNGKEERDEEGGARWRNAMEVPREEEHLEKRFQFEDAGAVEEARLSLLAQPDWAGYSRSSLSSKEKKKKYSSCLSPSIHPYKSFVRRRPRSPHGDPPPLPQEPLFPPVPDSFLRGSSALSHRTVPVAHDLTSLPPSSPPPQSISLSSFSSNNSKTPRSSSAWLNSQANSPLLPTAASASHLTFSRRPSLPSGTIWSRARSSTASSRAPSAHSLEQQHSHSEQVEQDDGKHSSDMDMGTDVEADKERVESKPSAGGEDDILSFPSSTHERNEHEEEDETPPCLECPWTSPPPAAPLPAHVAATLLSSPILDLPVNSSLPYKIGANDLFVTDSMGLGCTILTRQEALELVNRERALRRAAPPLSELEWEEDEPFDPRNFANAEEGDKELDVESQESLPRVDISTAPRTLSAIAALPSSSADAVSPMSLDLASSLEGLSVTNGKDKKEEVKEEGKPLCKSIIPPLSAFSFNLSSTTTTTSQTDDDPLASQPLQNRNQPRASSAERRKGLAMELFADDQDEEEDG
ncbi:hypothetical protein JCM8547_000928 [Rhodosporidiobolus lusitaniae]